MNKLLIFVGLTLFALISCEDKNDTKFELLLGTWNQKTGANFVYTPTVSFYKNGEYKICDLINSSYVLYKEVTISGEFNFNNNEIEFVTAFVEDNDSIDNTYVNIENPYISRGNSLYDLLGRWSTDSIFSIISSGKPFIIPNYSPMIWKVIVLSENQLKVIEMPMDTITYER